MEFGTIPANATLKPTAFTAHAPDAAVSDFKQLLRLSKVAPETFENLHEDLTYGVSRKWVEQAKQYWETAYDWRKCEARINSYPNFTVPISDGAGGTLTVHFAALFSQKPDAVPLILIHGWPGSFMEFFGMLDILKSRYSPKDLPFHVIVPSIPGYAYSSGPPLTRDWITEDQARVMNELMVGLGFGSGYVTQGGDIGSFISRVLVCQYEACKAVHLNFMIGIRPETIEKHPVSSMTAKEQAGVKKMNDFRTIGSGYSNMHATRPATIGLVLASSPIAQLAWIGEKFFVWTDKDPSLDEILDDVTLYWMTETFPRSIYNYRSIGRNGNFLATRPDLYIRKPFGFSNFPEELSPCPRAWVAESGDLSFWREHDDGGHFAAMEKPHVLLKDIEDFIAQVWPTASKL